jgi:hypothetical protein
VVTTIKGDVNISGILVVSAFKPAADLSNKGWVLKGFKFYSECEHQRIIFGFLLVFLLGFLLVLL